MPGSLTSNKKISAEAEIQPPPETYLAAAATAVVTAAAAVVVAATAVTAAATAAEENDKDKYDPETGIIVAHICCSIPPCASA